jgi:hypothetical protein
MIKAQPGRFSHGFGRGAAILAGVAIVAAGLSGCQGVKKQLGLAKTAPDEFEVVRNAPLTVPPDFTLRPPQPGAPRPQEAPIREQAEESIFRAAPADTATIEPDSVESRGESVLLQKAGAADTDPEIRQIVDREFSDFAREQDGFVEWVMFWREEEPLGTTVDAKAEAQRLRENAALGRAATEGDTPIIQRREKALLEGVF